MTRPRKSETARNKRVNLHKQRLLALGVPEEVLKHMTPPEIRELLRCPLKTKAKFAA
jgi:hypothetical protein